jgi:hypothetical protein
VRHWPRTIFIELAHDVRIRYCRTDQPPPVEYAITLELLRPDGWVTVRLWDNAHAPEEHHEHGYTRSGAKKAPMLLRFDSVNEAMAAAIEAAESNWRRFAAEWEKGDD